MLALIEFGASIESADADGWTLLHITSNSRELVPTKLLLSAGARTDVFDQEGM